MPTCARKVAQPQGGDRVPIFGGVREMTLEACDGCLRRTDLLAALAARLDIEWRRRSAPARVLSLRDEELVALDPTGAVAHRRARFRAAAARERIAEADLRAVCRCSPGYPERLCELPDPPAVLHVAGDPALLERADAVAIVGARRGTPYGLEVAGALGRAIATAGPPVVSGLALGVDSAAHAGALRGGRAVAVLAGGADVPYPSRNRRLHDQVRAAGCVVSELPPGFPPHRWAFVARNRLIAGLAAMTVVVEAAERSGSLTTADFAAQAGRAVGAVPGPVTSRFSEGANALLAAGALVIRDARDVLDVVLGAGAADRHADEAPHGCDRSVAGERASGDASPSAPVTLARDGGPVSTLVSAREPSSASPRSRRAAAGARATPPEPPEPGLRRLLRAIERGLGTPAELAAGPEDFGRVLHDLTELELRGLVRRDFGGRYVRALERA